MNPLYQILGTALGYLIAQAVRWLQKGRFWKRVEDNAAQLLADPAVPIGDAKAAAERALIEAQHAQLRAIERSIERGGNGFKPHEPSGLTDDDDTPRIP